MSVLETSPIVAALTAQYDALSLVDQAFVTLAPALPQDAAETLAQARHHVARARDCIAACAPLAAEGAA